MTSQKLFSTWTYCVSVSTGGVGEVNYRTVVADEHCSFHPYGVSGWPMIPPNFLAFRWAGAVQGIHHVEASKVVATLREAYPTLPATEEVDRQHIVYSLGPDLAAGRRLPNGRSIAPPASGSRSIYCSAPQASRKPSRRSARGTRSMQRRSLPERPLTEVCRQTPCLATAARNCDQIATKPDVSGGDRCLSRTSNQAVDQDQRGRDGTRRAGGDG